MNKVQAKVNLVLGEKQKLEKDFKAYEEYLAQNKLNQFKMPFVPLKMTERSHSCVNKNQKCMKLNSTFSKATANAWSKVRQDANSRSYSHYNRGGWFRAARGYSSSRSNSYYNADSNSSSSKTFKSNDRKECWMVDDCTKILAKRLNLEATLDHEIKLKNQ